jgi:endonuclease YncB( thermonuclease family)
MKATLYQYSLKNISVVDGDTLKADLDLGFGVILAGKKIRLEHVNCPEKNTESGVSAKQFTWNWVTGKSEPIVVNVKNHREDKYGRILGSITSDGQSLADALKIAGHGVDYEGGKR